MTTPYTLTQTGGSEAHNLPFIACSQGRRKTGRPTKCLLMLPPGITHPRACTKGHPFDAGWSCVHFVAHDEAEAVQRANALLDGAERSG